MHPYPLSLKVGKGGSNKHSFSSFASLDFEISDLQTVDYDNSTCLKFNMTAQIPMGDDSTDCIMTVCVINTIAVHHGWDFVSLPVFSSNTNC